MKATGTSLVRLPLLFRSRRSVVYACHLVKIKLREQVYMAMPLPEACPKLARRCTAVMTHTEGTSLIIHLLTSAHTQ